MRRPSLRQARNSGSLPCPDSLCPAVFAGHAKPIGEAGLRSPLAPRIPRCYRVAMGDVFVPMRLVGVRADGSPSAKGHATFKTLVDTGASKTIVSEAVARRVGIRRMGEGHMSGAGGLVRVDLGLALALVDGCNPELLIVGISDPIAETAGADVVMGHDYLQAVRMAVRPYTRSAQCEAPGPALKPRKAPRKPATNTAGRGPTASPRRAAKAPSRPAGLAR